MKTYRAVDYWGYKSLLFIGIKSLMVRSNGILKLWPSKKSAIIVTEYDCDGNVAVILLDILQESVGSKQGLEISDEIW